MTIGKYLFTVTLFVCSVHTEVPFIHKCVSTDSACLKQSAQAALPVIAAGIPEMNIESLDPLRVNHIDASSTELKFTSTDIVITGLKDCVIEELERNIESSKIIVGMVCDVDYKSKYEVKGQILKVQFDGKGDMHLVLPQTYFYVDSDIETKVDKNGQKHWHVNKYTYKHTLRGEPQLELTNLFEGNEVLGHAARELIRSSTNEIILEIGPNVVKAIIGKIVDNIKRFYSIVPISDLAID